MCYVADMLFFRGWLVAFPFRLQSSFKGTQCFCVMRKNLHLNPIFFNFITSTQIGCVETRYLCDVLVQRRAIAITLPPLHKPSNKHANGSCSITWNKRTAFAIHLI